MNAAGEYVVILPEFGFLDPVAHCMTVMRGETHSALQMSRTRFFTRSQAHSLLSNSISKSEAAAQMHPTMANCQASMNFSGFDALTCSFLRIVN
jgi:hypothetical protein